MNTGMLKGAVYALSRYYVSGDYAKNFESKEVADIVVNHSAAAGISAMAAGVLPGVGAILATGVAVGAIWTMYFRIAKYLNLHMGKGTWKAIASAVLTNIVTQLAGILALELAVGFIPGASILAAGVVNFGVTYAAGVIFLKALTGIFADGKDPRKMGDEEMNSYFSNAAGNVNAKDVFKEAKGVFKEMKKDGSLKEKGEHTNIEK